MHVTVMIASYAALLLGCIVSLAYLIFLFSVSKSMENQRLKSNIVNSTDSFQMDANFETIRTKDFSTNFQNRTQNSQPLESNNIVATLKNNVFADEKFLDFLDNLSYRTIGIGFCFLTLGILSGAVWANETWGNYWSWDPKETWALITWLTFAAYLHSRFVGGWSGSKPAWIATGGFVIIWICYLGVNLLGQGLHSYGFLQS
jgi:cytochrome c-type biogenesis protein CcsB